MTSSIKRSRLPEAFSNSFSERSPNQLRGMMLPLLPFPLRNVWLFPDWSAKLRIERSTVPAFKNLSTKPLSMPSYPSSCLVLSLLPHRLPPLLGSPFFGF